MFFDWLKLLAMTDSMPIRGAKLKSGKSHLERSIQHLYPLELSCDTSVQTPPKTLNADAPVYRPRRDAAAAARFRIQDMNENEP